MALNFFISNKLEVLIDKLADVLKTPLASPLAQENIVVQSRGMQRWVAMELARKWGICANILFSFPNAILYDLTKRLIPDLPETSPFERSILTWKVMKLLPSCMDKPGFENVTSYLSSDSGVKHFQISERIADSFDQYLIFRPEMIRGWEQDILTYPGNREEQWQAELWRLIVRNTDCAHRAQLMDRVLTIIDQDVTCKEKLPERITVFGISFLPPFHMHFFDTLSKVINVSLFFMNPCREYWGDILSDRETVKIFKKYKEVPLQKDLHTETGNNLLATLGMHGREFFNLIQGSDFEQNEYFEDSGEDSILSCIQSDIINLKDRSIVSGKKTLIDKNDSSIQIHSCHSPMREIEVLHDNLLAMFDEDPELRPHDILVMTPDLDTYVPFFQAVFNAPEKDNLKIPFSIADRSILKDNNLCRTFLSLCELYNSRFRVSQVMPILEAPAVQRKFGLSEDDVELIQSWIAESHIRWGIDENSKLLNHLPVYKENTWKAGLERMLLGYAMSGKGKYLFNGILPYDHVEGESTRTLGILAEFTSRLVSLSHKITRAKTLHEWSIVLSDVLELFFEPDAKDEHILRIMQNIFANLALTQSLSGFDQPISIDVIQEYLKGIFKQQINTSGFITGGVTFCAMLPMRSIPFKVIYLIGMNDGSFPRQLYPPGFNLIAQNPKPCDRSLKKDDRYLFLEVILSTRNRLYISYIGQSHQDSSIIPPSVVVSELTDYLEQGFIHPEKEILRHIITRHRLQAFSPKYFQHIENLFSFSEENCTCAQKLHEPNNEPEPFIQANLPEPEDTYRTIDIQELISFFANPARFLLQRRLGLYLEKEDLPLEDYENFILKGLDRYGFEQNLLEKQLDGIPREAGHLITKARGILPHGTVGEWIYNRTFDEISDFVEIVSDFMGHSKQTSIHVNLTIDQFNLTGRFEDIYQSRLVKYRYAVLKPKDFLMLWLRHVLLNAENENFESVLIGLKEKSRLPVVWKYYPTDDNVKILKNLLRVYWEGLIQPVAFFPQASFEFAIAIITKGVSVDKARKTAQKKLEGSEFVPGDLDDAYVNLCFGKSISVSEQFMNLALEVYEPLLKHRQELK